MMKKLLLFVFLLSAAGLAAQNRPFVLDTPGTVAKFRTTDAKGKVTGYSTRRVVGVDKTDERNYTATISLQLADENGKPEGEPIVARMVVRNGAVDMGETFRQSLSTQMAELAKEGYSARFSGTYPSMPDDPAIGDVQNYDFRIAFTDDKTDKAKLTMTITGSLRVVARERITTPAGEFDCVKCSSEKAAKILVISKKGRETEWYAPGIGAVRTETLSKNGRLEEVEELISISKI